MRIICAGLLAILASIRTEAGNRNVSPLPEDRGTAGVLAAVQKLPVHARVLYTIAHPDDEGSGVLVWLARKAHARTALFSLTRGDGGQNALGTEKYEAMGLVRTGELLEASRLYGVETWFGTVFEFGFSKTADETLAKWGRDATLEEVVRFIRWWRPTIIISRFRGDPSGGHGHHQAAGILTAEAYRAAADPRRFPNHAQAGLHPWLARKLYYDSNGEDRTVMIPVGQHDPVLGRSYREIGAEGYSKHRSQGNGGRYSLPGEANDYLKLVDAAVPVQAAEDSIFDSIDASLLSILQLGGGQGTALPALRPALQEAQSAAEEALRLFDPLHPEKSAPAAAKGCAAMARAVRTVEGMPENGGSRELLVAALRQKHDDFNEAVNALLGIYLVASSQNPEAVPGQNEQVTVTFFNRGSEAVNLKDVTVRIPQDWPPVANPGAAPGRVDAGKSVQRRFAIRISNSAKPTEPFWYRENPNDNRYRTRPTPNVFAPFDPPVLSGSAAYRFADVDLSIGTPVRAQAGDTFRGADFIDFQIVPAISVSLTPSMAVAPISSTAQSKEFQVSIVNNRESGASGAVKLQSGAGWRIEPAEASFSTSRKGESVTLRFKVQIPPGAAPGKYPIEAVGTVGGQEFRRGYQVVSYPENWTRNLYSPARAGLELFDFKLPPQLSIGYVMGAGDEVPQALEQAGAKVSLLTGNDLASGDLGRFAAIVVGIRAYNVNDDLRSNNARLLRYVEQGGTLIVQYNTPIGGSSASFPYGPYSMSNSAGDRITVEESPIRLLQPGDPLLSSPNKITEADFKGWVQERGLYFMRQWDPRYTALLSGHDPGETPKNGGMLVARYGKGTYIYSAYAWFRQLPAGVPGAYRIFANMLSAGTAKAAKTR
jgi:LmbE family N-acetylglucosaminyl deacetylase